MPERSIVGVEQAIKALLGTSQLLRAAHAELVEEWSPDEPPLTIIFSNLGRCLCNQSSSSSEQAMMEACTVIEELMSRGDDTVKNAVATGMLEAMLAESSAGRCDFLEIGPLLGANSRSYCRSWDEFTGNQTPGLLDG